MIQFDKTSIASLLLHQTGNKLNDEGLRLSKTELRVDENIHDLLMTYFLTPFKSEEYYTLYHEAELKLNEVYTYVSEIFDDTDRMYAQSVNIAKHLYEQSTHPKIKGGELYVAYLKDCMVDGETVDAVGIFKSETKDTFLKVHAEEDGFLLESETGVNINKLDKGCLIFNTEREKGYVVAVVDNQNRGAEAQYWLDHFLHARPRNDAYFQTKNAMSLCRKFVTDRMPEAFDVSKADQADILNKSVKFFKENDNFDFDDFAQEVMQQPAVIESFNAYKSDFEQERDLQLNKNFDISDSAVKKQSRVLKSVIKLDKNFHIYVHGNREFIEKGYDETTGMHYYKLLFREEG
jgi:hypothetical protein